MYCRQLSRVRLTFAGALQREVLGTLLAAYEDSTTPEHLKVFIARSVRHHVTQSQDPNVVFHQDTMLMGVLTHSASVICARGVAGIGLESVRMECETCESLKRWLVAAQLWYAISAINMQVNSFRFVSLFWFSSFSSHFLALIIIMIFIAT